MNTACVEMEGPASQVRTIASRATLSERLWDVSWDGEMCTTIDGITVEIGSFASAFPFVEEHWASIFGDEAERFFAEEMTDAKRRFWDEMDVFVFRSEGRTVGIMAGHPSDWSSYYVRTLALLPEYRERRFATSIADPVKRVLRGAGVKRLEAECSVANVAMTRLFVSQGFMISSMLASERWGVMVRFTSFLDERAESAFRRQLVNVPSFGKRDGQPQRRKS